MRALAVDGGAAFARRPRPDAGEEAERGGAARTADGDDEEAERDEEAAALLRGRGRRGEDLGALAGGAGAREPSVLLGAGGGRRRLTSIGAAVTPGWCARAARARAARRRDRWRGPALRSSGNAGRDPGAGLLDDLVDGEGHVGALGGGARHRLFGVPAHDLVLALGVEGHLAHEHLVEHDAERVDVDPLVEIAPAGDLLGRHVPERSEDALGLLARDVGGDLGDAEVRDLGHPVLAADEHVGGLHVPVNHALLVGGGEARGDLPERGERVVDGHALAPRRVAGDGLVEALAVDVLHHEPEARAVDDDRLEVDDVGVIDLREARPSARCAAGRRPDARARSARP